MFRAPGENISLGGACKVCDELPKIDSDYFEES